MYTTMFSGGEKQKSLFCYCNLTQEEKRRICMSVLIFDKLISFSESLKVVIFATFLFVQID